MASGVLATVDLAATTITDIYTPTTGLTADVNVSVCNRNAADATVRLALSATSVTQAAGEFIEYGTVVALGKPLSITGITIDDGYTLTAYSDLANVSVVVTGYES